MKKSLLHLVLGLAENQASLMRIIFGKKKKVKMLVSQFSSDQCLSHVWLFVTQWTAARQASLSIINTQSLLKLMSHWDGDAIQPSSSVIPFSSWLQTFQAWGCFPMSQCFPSGGQSIGASASASVPPVNIQDWFPLGLTGLISLQFNGLSSLLQYHSSKASILWCSAFFNGPTFTSIQDYWKNHSFDYTDLCW